MMGWALDKYLKAGFGSATALEAVGPCEAHVGVLMRDWCSMLESQGAASSLMEPYRAHVVAGLPGGIASVVEYARTCSTLSELHRHLGDSRLDAIRVANMVGRSCGGQKGCEVCVSLDRIGRACEAREIIQPYVRFLMGACVAIRSRMAPPLASRDWVPVRGSDMFSECTGPLRLGSAADGPWREGFFETLAAHGMLPLTLPMERYDVNDDVNDD